MSRELVSDGGATVLVVAPGDALADAVERASEAFDVRTAATTAGALPHLDAADAVVSDHDEPAVDGLTLLQQVREAYGDLPFVMCTANGSEAVASEAISAGVTDYLRRTDDGERIADLADRVADAIASRRARRAVVESHGPAEMARGQVLRTAPATLGDALDALDDIFYVFDAAGQLVWWSDRLPEVTGYTHAEIAEMSPTEFFIDDETDRVREYVREVEETGSGRLETFIETTGGEVIPYELYSDELTDGTGQVVGRVGIARDISERKSVEWELEQQNARLDEFASVLSHDLRNPLGIAQGYLRMLSVPEEEEQHAARVEQALDRIDRIIEDVLALSRTGDLVAGLEPVEFGSVAADSWEAVDRRLAALELDGTTTLLADRSLLERLLTNLFRNAAEHGGDDVTVQAGTLDDRQGFYVGDDGPGIPEADRERVFDWQHTTKEGGSGIGLRSVEQIVEAHEWTIAITESEAGGARFEVRGVERHG